MDTERLGDSDGVCDLDHAPPTELVGDEVLGNPPGGIGGRPIHLGGIFAGEGSSSVSSPPTVGIGDDLPASEPGVAGGSSDHELLAWVDDVLGVFEPLGVNDMLYDVLDEVGADGLVGDVGVVLGRDQHGVHPDGLDALGGGLVLHSHLHLPVGAQPLHDLLVAALLKPVDQLVGDGVGEGHQVLALVASIADHEALVTRPDVLGRLVDVDGVGDLGRLPVDGDDDRGGPVIHAWVYPIMYQHQQIRSPRP